VLSATSQAADPNGCGRRKEGSEKALMRQWTRGARKGGDVPNDDRVVLRGGPHVAAGATAVVIDARVFAAFGEEPGLWAVARRAGPDRHGDKELRC